LPRKRGAAEIVAPDLGKCLRIQVVPEPAVSRPQLRNRRRILSGGGPFAALSLRGIGPDAVPPIEEIEERFADWALTTS